MVEDDHRRGRVWMAEEMTRRELLTRSAGATVALTTATTLPAEAAVARQEGPKKSVLFGMLPKDLSLEDKFKLARDVGFAGIEAPPVSPQEAEKLRAAADKAGVHIHSIIHGGWDAPLSSADPAVVEKGMNNVRTSLHSGQIMGCESILLVPAVVNAETRYVDAYTRSQANIRKLIPEAEKRKVRIDVEEVWNNFLLSPMEFAAYVDSFKSPWVQAYFDVGNVVAFAWPEDWIRTLGKRIKKVHLKDYKGGPGLFGSRNGNFVNLRDGSINWPEVRKAFREIGFTGYMTTELNGGDEAYLRDVSARVDKILGGE
jgi:L-ribulose-5-phosphate 3-epimerase